LSISTWVLPWEDFFSSQTGGSAFDLLQELFRESNIYHPEGESTGWNAENGLLILKGMIGEV